MSLSSAVIGPPEVARKRSRNPFSALRARIHRWAMARLPLSDTITLSQGNIYILPSRAGWMLAVTLAVLLVASINYQLNLGYLLTFLLAGSATVGMHVCHSTLRGLKMSLVAPEPQFMGSGAGFNVSLTNERRGVRYGIGLAVLDEALVGHWAYTDVPAQASTMVRIAFQPRRRGRHRLPALNAETRYPLGTFRVWTVWRPAAEVTIYPAPEPNAPPLPPGEPRTAGNATTRVQSSGEFDGVRAYQRGDPLKRVVWKKAAKTGELVSRDSSQAQREELWLDFKLAGGGGTEVKLSRLCAWVLRADALGVDYGLRLPGVTIEPAEGEAHKRRCLEALALA
ncbi:MAG: DUF58 domain-containing protein [Burkholderiales bacterium]